MQDLAAFILKTQFFLLHCRRHAVTSRILFVLKVVSLLAFLLLFSLSPLRAEREAYHLDLRGDVKRDSKAREEGYYCG